MEVGGVENGDGDDIGRVGPKRAGQTREQSPLPEGLQEPASTERGRVDVHVFKRKRSKSGLKPAFDILSPFLAAPEIKKR